MMRYWNVERARDGHLNLIQAGNLIAAIGHDDIHALPMQILTTLNDVAPVSQCTIFAYEFGNRPRTIALADRRGGQFLNDVAQTYARLFYALDGNQAVISVARQRLADPQITLHHQSSDDIANEAYREACYKRPNVSDRLSLLVQPEKDVWLSVNLYRDRDAGKFVQGEIDRIEALTPLFAHAARHHYTMHGQGDMDALQLMLARVRRACPALSKRELDVLGGVLAGHTALDIADIMGIKPSSVVTYQKRAYQRIGISSQRQLFALCLSGARN